MSRFGRGGQRDPEPAAIDGEPGVEMPTLESILEASPDLIGVFSRDLEVLFASATVRSSLGFEPTELVGGPSAHLMHPEDLAELSGDLRSQDAALLVGPNGAAIRMRVRHADGHYVPFEGHVRALDGDLTGGAGYVAIFRDVTEELLLDRSLLQAKEQAEAANRAKSEFLSRMSHELRTPLNSVLGFAELMAMDLPMSANTEHLHFLSQIVGAGRHLLRLVEDVLDLSQVDAGRLELTLAPLDVGEVAGRCIEMVRPQASVRGTTCVLDEASVCVIGSDRRLTQVLLNLLTNALTHGEGEVRLGARREGDSVTIEVSDQGGKIPNDQVDRLFRPFERLSRSSSGTGLGLALCARLVERMNGRIGLESDPGERTTFWVELPAAPYPCGNGAREELGELVRTEGPTTGRVLYVDDDESNLNLAVGVMRLREHVSIATARTGEEGLAFVRADPPDLLLLDVHLPGMSGAEVLHELRDDPVTADLPVIMLSADAIPSHAYTYLLTGADAYLTKPAAPSLILQVIDTVLGAPVDQRRAAAARYAI